MKISHFGILALFFAVRKFSSPLFLFLNIIIVVVVVVIEMTWSL